MNKLNTSAGIEPTPSCLPGEEKEEESVPFQ
jgi:hypothetical protein